MATALEKDLVRTLQALALQDLPETSIKAVFDTGGTALRRQLQPDDDAADVSLDQLVALDRIFLKYLKQFLATTSDGDDAMTSDGSSPLWGFLAAEEANTAIMGDESERAHPFAAYRALFTLLHSMIAIGEGYAQLDAQAKMHAVVKAAVAAKVYLTWLQLPGGAAYGLFMPFVYRQVLDVAKKWIDIAVAPTSSSGSAASQREQTPRKKGSSRRGQAARHDIEDLNTLADLQRKLYKHGAELIGTITSFLQHFALSSSRESIVPTVEMVAYIQSVGMSADSGTVSSAVDRSRQVLDELLHKNHGDIMQIGRVIIHCYIPGLTFQEAIAVEMRNGVKFHKLASDIIGSVLSHVSRALKAAQLDDEDNDESAEQMSTLCLALAQNVCLQAPDRAEERQRVLSYVYHVCIAPDFIQEDRLRFVRFLSSYSRSVKAKNRQFAVELIGKLMLEPTTWENHSNDPLEENRLAAVAPMLEILAERSRDKVSSVRAKAIGAISAVLTAGLKNVDAPEHAGSRGDSEPTDETNADADIIAAVLGEILYNRDDDDEIQETELMGRLVELFREGLQDEKTFVRKAAIQALEALIIVRPGEIDPSMKKDLFDMQSRCTDSSLLVRVQAIKSVSAVLMKFPDDEEAQRLWSIGVLPLCADPEASVQAAALQHINFVVFDRIAQWYDTRRNPSQQQELGTVWALVGHLDGVLVRCAQKSLQLLLKDSKVNAKKIIKASIYAIKSCLKDLDESGETEPQYWGFSWVLLEELANSGKLVEAAKSEQQNLGIVVECWNKLQEDELPHEFVEGSKRILRVIAALAPVIDAQDAKEIAGSILSSLQSFSIPLNVIADAVLALHSICKAKAPSEEKGREISFDWGKKLLAACEANLRACFEGEPELVLEQTGLIQKQLISIGEVSLLEFSKDDDKARESGITLIPITSVKSLVQLFLPPEIVPNSLQSSQRSVNSDAAEDSTGASVSIPIPVRVCAFVTLGKMCLRDQELAKSCITMFIRELRTCPNQDIRSNILIILGDLCIRYTSMVDVYISSIALSFLDNSPLIRRNALLLFSQLILQDYIKWRESLLRFFLRAVVDDDDDLSGLARHTLCGPLLQKSPHLFTNKFIEMIFVFNRFEGKVNLSEPFEREGIEEISLPGSAQYSKRSQLYKFLLQNMTDEQKLQISMKLCTEILEEVTDGKLKLSENPSQITDFGTEAVLKDTFAILCSPDIKLSTSRENEGDDADPDDGAEAAEGVSVASQLAAAKGKLLSKMSKKNFLENIVPVLIGLKHKLESKRSPLMRYLLHYIRELFKLYGQEVRDILSADPQMAMEVEYDLRQYELQQKQQTNDLGRSGSSVTPTKATGSSGAQRTPRTPLEELQGAQTPQLLSAAERARRRQSMPTAGTPSLPIQQRQVNSDDAKKDSTAKPMLFSPDKGRDGRDKWHVTAKSPTIMNKHASKSAEEESIPDSTQRDLASVFDQASSPERPPRTKQASRSRKPAKATEEQEEDEVDLQLKKKPKKKAKSSKASSKQQPDTSQRADPMELATPQVRRTKRKRN
ncbi:hypothetical protein PINS_up022522 [Pythium insidiosum]|nr:hypothetical protein PINS_up010505 [Pythium insidiosum]GLE10421.1 hypothetical protein PINS_up022522 [Pythium insidiosum]